MEYIISQEYSIRHPHTHTHTACCCAHHQALSTLHLSTQPQGDPRASETFLLDNNILTVKVLCTCVSECQPQWGSPGVYRLSQQARVWWGTSVPTGSSSSPTGWGPRQLGSVNALSGVFITASQTQPPASRQTADCPRAAPDPVPHGQ